MSWKLTSANVVVPLESVEGGVEQPEQKNTVKKNMPSFLMEKPCGMGINSNHLAGHRDGQVLHNSWTEVGTGREPDEPLRTRRYTDHVAPGCNHVTRGSDTYCGAGCSLFRFFSQEGQHQLHLVLLLLADVVGVCGGKELVQSADMFRGNGGSRAPRSPVPVEPDSKLKHLRQTRITDQCV